MEGLFSNKSHSVDEILKHLADNKLTVVSRTPGTVEITNPGIAPGTPESKAVRQTIDFVVRDAAGKDHSYRFMQQRDGGYAPTGFKTAGEDEALKNAKTVEERHAIETRIRDRNQELLEKQYYEGLGLGSFTHKTWQEHLARKNANDRAAEELKFQQATRAAREALINAQVGQAQAQTGLTNAQTAATATNAAANTMNAETNRTTAEANIQAQNARLALDWATKQAEERIKRGTLAAANAEVWIKNQVEAYKALLEENRWILDAANKQAELEKQQRDQDITLRNQDLSTSTTQSNQALEFVRSIIPTMKDASSEEIAAALDGALGIQRLNTQRFQETIQRPDAVTIPAAIQQMAQRQLTQTDPTKAFDLAAAYEFGQNLMNQQLGKEVFANESRYNPGYATPADDSPTSEVGQRSAAPPYVPPPPPAPTVTNPAPPVAAPAVPPAPAPPAVPPAPPAPQALQPTPITPPAPLINPMPYAIQRHATPPHLAGVPWYA